MQFKNKSEYDDHVTSKVCIYRIPFPTKIVLPPKNSKISFKSLGKTLPPHLICYTDSESMLLPNNDLTSGDILHIHEMVSFAYVILNGITGDILTYNLLFGKNISKEVVPTLRAEYEKYHKQFVDEEVPLHMKKRK